MTITDSHDEKGFVSQLDPFRKTHHVIFANAWCVVLRTLGFEFRLSSLEHDYRFRSRLEQNEGSIRFPVRLSSPGI